MSVEKWMRYNAEHLDLHAAQIERTLAGWNARS
jgi:hypothetical protein